MKTVLFGVGAAGNKAALTAYKEGVVNAATMKLINSTTQDIPEEFKNHESTIKFGNGGCGKESIKGRKAMFDEIKNRKIDLSRYIDIDTKMVCIVTSTEGGTGSGATPVIAKYFCALNIPVHVFAFIGFQEDARGINNTLTFFKNLPSEVVLHTINNDEFLDYDESHTDAELAANEEFVTQFKILTCRDIISSSQNFDTTEQLKMISTAGYMDIVRVNLDSCKSEASVNEAIQDAFDNSSLEHEDLCKRMAIIINASEKTLKYVDERFAVIKRYTGEPLEIFKHIQYVPELGEHMDVMIAGIPYPTKDITKMSAKLNEMKSKLISDSCTLANNFFDNMGLDDDIFAESSIKEMANPDEVISEMFGGPSVTNKHQRHVNESGTRAARMRDVREEDEDNNGF